LLYQVRHKANIGENQNIANPMLPKIISEKTLPLLTQVICQKDPDLARVVADFDTPPLWKRNEGLPTLMHIILEQQVSLASANAMFERICAMCKPEAECLRAFGTEGLRSIGVTRQKAGYIVGAAEAVISGKLNFAVFQTMSDDAVRGELMKLNGIGTWTADVYLLMALSRADVFPSGDLALQIATQGIKRLPKRPTSAELEALSDEWRPYRAVAARVLWQWYLKRR
jgi:DNA-3-methyladenine glycosylase II